MAYLKIGNDDFSDYCQELQITYKPLYNSLTNAAGNAVIDFISSKRTIEATLRAMNDTEMAALLAAIANYSVSISFREPKTNALAANVDCFISDIVASYYTIQKNKVLYNSIKLVFEEL